MKLRALTQLLALALLLATGCSAIVPGTARREPSTARISHSAGVTLTVNPHLTVSVPDGAVESESTLSVQPSTVALPPRPEFISAAAPVDVTVDAPLKKPVTLTFDNKGGPEGALPAVLRHEPGLGWYPVEVGEPGQPLAAQRIELSNYLFGWFTPAVTWLRDRLVGRTDPVQCGPKPEWAQSSGPKVDVVTSCLTTDSGQAALTVRGNRAIPLEVVFPNGTNVSVKDQPEPLRRLIGGLVGADRVVLFGGQDLTLRWPQPAQAATRTVLARFTLATQITRVVTALLGVEDYRGVAGLGVFVLGCKQIFSAPDVPAGLEALMACLAPMTTEVGSRTAAISIIAQMNGLSEDVVASDRGFFGSVDKLRNGLRAAGRLIKFYTVAKLSAELAQAAKDSMSSDADRSVVVRLTGTEPPPIDSTFLGTWSQHAGGLEISASRIGRISYQVQSAGPAEFYKLDLKLESGGPGVLKATVTGSDDPEKPRGTVLTLQRAHPGIVIIGLRQQNSRWCDAVNRQNGECGA